MRMRPDTRGGNTATDEWRMRVGVGGAGAAVAAADVRRLLGGQGGDARRAALRRAPQGRSVGAGAGPGAGARTPICPSCVPSHNSTLSPGLRHACAAPSSPIPSLHLSIRLSFHSSTAVDPYAARCRDVLRECPSVQCGLTVDTSDVRESSNCSPRR